MSLSSFSALTGVHVTLLLDTHTPSPTPTHNQQTDVKQHHLSLSLVPLCEQWLCQLAEEITTPKIPHKAWQVFVSKRLVIYHLQTPSRPNFNSLRSAPKINCAITGDAVSKLSQPTCLSFPERLLQTVRSHVIGMLGTAVVFTGRWHVESVWKLDTLQSSADN